LTKILSLQKRFPQPITKHCSKRINLPTYLLNKLIITTKAENARDVPKKLKDSITQDNKKKQKFSQLWSSSTMFIVWTDRAHQMQIYIIRKLYGGHFMVP